MASFEFKLPDIGEGIVEGEIVKWLVKEGDEVVEDQPLVEVMTDKATVVIPSPRHGKVVALHGAEGTMARVHRVLVTLEVGEDGQERPADAAPRNGAAAGDGAALGGETAALTAAGLATPSGKVLATPVTRRIAREHGIDLAQVPGTGPQGRVLKSDVLRLVGAPLAASAPAPRNEVETAPGKEPAAPVASADGDQRLPLRGLRRAIARKMVASKQHAPHYTFVEECDATALKALRARLNQKLAQAGAEQSLSFLPFIVKAVAAAMRSHPTVNAVFDEAAEELVVRREVNVGIAVATEEGLIVPVVKDVRSKSLRELGEQIAQLAQAAREKRLKHEDLVGGTFTITSLGERGGLFATPIINHPEVAILGVHRMRPTPVVREGAIQVRDIMHLSLAFDHRVIDGAVGASFTYEVIRYLENPELLMLEMA